MAERARESLPRDTIHIENLRKFMEESQRPFGLERKDEQLLPFTVEVLEGTGDLEHRIRLHCDDQSLLPKRITEAARQRFRGHALDRVREYVAFSFAAPKVIKGLPRREEENVREMRPVKRGSTIEFLSSPQFKRELERIGRSLEHISDSFAEECASLLRNPDINRIRIVESNLKRRGVFKRFTEGSVTIAIPKR